MFKRLMIQVILLLVAAGAAWAATPQLDLGSVTVGAATTSVTIPVTLTNAVGTDISSLALDIGYDTNLLGSPTASIGPAGSAAGKTVVKSTPSAGVFRIGILSLTDTAVIGNGVVANVTFTLIAASGSATLANTPSASDPDGNPVTITGANATVTIDTVAPATTASPVGGVFKTAQNVTLSCGDGTNGSGCAATTYCLGAGCTPATPYAGAISIAASQTLRFFSADNVGNSEAVKTEVYTFDTTPPTTTASPAGGLFNGAQSVSLTANESATIYFTTDGTTPTTGSSQYSSPIPVTATTTLKFFAVDAVGNSETFKTATYTIDTIVPTTAASPAGGNHSGSQSVTLSCTDTGGAGCKETLYCLGTTTCSPQTPYTGPVTVASSQDLYFYSTDNAGNSGGVMKEHFVILPGVAASPDAGAYNTAKDVTLSANPAAGAVILYSADGTQPSLVYTAPIHIAETTTLTIVVKDAFGNAAQPITKTYTIDTTPPTLTVSTLSNGAVTNNATLNVSGGGGDNLGVLSVTINGQQVAIDTTTNEDGSVSYTFSTTYSLSTGQNQIATVTTDLAGSTISDSRTITLDQAAPVITVTAPADNSRINQTIVDVTGSVDESATVSITVNGGSSQAATMTGTSFGATVSLVSGINTIEITATDTVENKSNAIKRTVISDMGAPSLTVTDPGQDIRTSRQSVTIKGTASDALTAVTVTIAADGKTFTPQVAQDGSFAQSVGFSAEKTHAVVVTAVDEAGNQTVMQRNIIFSTPDLNSDGKVDVADALLALQTAVGFAAPTAEQLYRGDVAPLVNGQPSPDQTIDVADAVVILRKVVGLLNW